MQMRSHTDEELRSLAADFIRSLAAEERAVLITLSGELGAGKTTFAQGVARALGVVETVTSPTFVIEKVYALAGQKWDRLIHIDAYRLSDTRELDLLKWHELLSDRKNVIVLEWPERVLSLIPADAHALKFDIDGDARIITEYGEKSGI